MQNKLLDLNNHLFEQLERLNDEDLDEKQLNLEIKRASAMANISNQIIQNAKVELDATKVCLEYGNLGDMKNLPPMLKYDSTSKIN